MKLPFMKKDSVWILDRRRFRPGQHPNSPRVEEWKRIGRVPAPTREAALKRGEEITGDTRENLRIVGMASGAK